MSKLILSLPLVFLFLSCEQSALMKQQEKELAEDQERILKEEKEIEEMQSNYNKNLDTYIEEKNKKIAALEKQIVRVELEYSLITYKHESSEKSKNELIDSCKEYEKYYGAQTRLFFEACGRLEY